MKMKGKQYFPTAYIEKLRNEIKYIKEKTFDDKGRFVRELTDEELEGLHKP
jgi:hypothetical protein